MRHSWHRCVRKLPDPWTHRTRPQILAKPQNGFAQASTRLIVGASFRRTKAQNLSVCWRATQGMLRRRQEMMLIYCGPYRRGIGVSTASQLYSS